MIIEVEALKAGVLIQSDIKDNTGKVVVKAGTKTTPLLLKRLITWGVKTVDIEVVEKTNVAPTNSQESNQQEKKPQINFDKELIKIITKRFSNVREDELMDKIMRLAIKHLSMKSVKK
jgi:hypothetical protein